VTEENVKDESGSATNTPGANSGINLDPTRMQEMLNPQTMSAYMNQVSSLFR
jgi:hypothetical protein